MVPPIVLALARHPMVDDYDLSSVRTLLSGAAPLGPELAAEAAAPRRMRPVVQGYGMTELSPVSHATPWARHASGYGRDCSSRIARRAWWIPRPATISASASDGELWIRGPQVMKGYLNNANATAATIDGDGWLHTGDIGHVDADGYWYIVDRAEGAHQGQGLPGRHRPSSRRCC